MKCQRCQKREATILIKQSINGKEKEYMLCQECMQELGLATGFGIDLDNYLGAGFISPQMFSSLNPQNSTGAYNSGVFVSGKKEVQVCEYCNTTLDEVRKKGRLGCSHCYDTFEEQLGQVFRRIQSGDKHRGRRIAESKEKSEVNKLHDLNEELQLKIKQAVEKEDYESAAICKTQILQNKEKIMSLENQPNLCKTSDKARDKTSDKASNKASDKTSDKANDKTSDKANDKTNDEKKAVEKSIKTNKKRGTKNPNDNHQ